MGATALFMQELIAALRKGTLQLDCPEMVLTQDGTATPEIVRGPGYIRQEVDGQFVFKLYSSSPDVEHDLTKPYEDLIAGQLVPTNRYFSLRATDEHTRVWTAERVRAATHFGQMENGGQSVIRSGFLREIKCVEQGLIKAKGQHVSIVFFEEFDIPYNDATVVEKSIGGRRVSGSFCRNVAAFRAAGFECRIMMDDGTTTVDITTEEILPPRFEIRVIEALQFILASTLWPRVIQVTDSDSDITRFTSAAPSSAKPRMSRPIEPGTLEDLHWTWVLFDKYLSYISRFPGDGWHPCTRHLYAVSKASIASVHSEALALCVAVEGICNEVFGDLCKPPPSFLSAVESFQDYAHKWRGDGSSEDAAVVRKRLSGLIGMLRKPRPVDRMNLLANLGWIDNKLITAWTELRNKTAHGATPEWRVPQQFLDQRQQVTDLLYQLIFCAIRYVGVYIIRTPKAWGPRKYPSSQFWASRIGNVRLNAYYRWLNRGALHGNDLDDWLAAEKEILDSEWDQVSPSH